MEGEGKWKEREKMRKWRKSEEIAHSILAFVVSITKILTCTWIKTDYEDMNKIQIPVKYQHKILFKK